jgi:hypothetical protein
LENLSGLPVAPARRRGYNVCRARLKAPSVSAEAPKSDINN